MHIIVEELVVLLPVVSGEAIIPGSHHTRTTTKINPPIYSKINNTRQQQLQTELQLALARAQLHTAIYTATR